LAAFPAAPPPPSSHALVSLWRTVAPPPSLLEGPGEGETEIDVVIEAPTWVWFIETAAGGKDRARLLRDLDAGSYHAGVRAFYFSLLVPDPARARAAVS